MSRAARARRPDSRRSVFGETMATALPAYALGQVVGQRPAGAARPGRVGQREDRRRPWSCARARAAAPAPCPARNPSARRRQAAELSANVERIGERHHLGRQLGRRDVQVLERLAVGVVVDGDAQLLQALGRRRVEPGVRRRQRAAPRRPGCRRTAPTIAQRRQRPSSARSTSRLVQTLGLRSRCASSPGCSGTSPVKWWSK